MYTIKDLADSVGLSESQVRRRLSALDGLVSIHRRQANKVLVDHNGLELLKQLEGYRKSNMTTDQAIEQIKEDLDDSGGVKHRQASKNLEELVKQLRQENQFLKEELKERDQQIRQLLPGSTDRKGIIRRIWERVW